MSNPQIKDPKISEITKILTTVPRRCVKPSYLSSSFSGPLLPITGYHCSNENSLIFDLFEKDITLRLLLIKYKSASAETS